MAASGDVISGYVERVKAHLARRNAPLQVMSSATAADWAAICEEEKVPAGLERVMAIGRIEQEVKEAVHALASSGGERKMHRRQIGQRHQHCILMTCLSVPVCVSVLAAPTKKRRSEGIGITQRGSICALIVTWCGSRWHAVCCLPCVCLAQESRIFRSRQTMKKSLRSFGKSSSSCDC